MIPLVPSTGVMVKVTPLQLVTVSALTVAAGFNVTVTVNGTPAPQLVIIGVTI